MEKVFTMAIGEDDVFVDLQVLKAEWEQDLCAIIGTANNSNCCPLAVAFMREYPDAELVSVWGDSINYTIIENGNHKRKRHYLPSMAQEFIARVDNLVDSGDEEGEEGGSQEPVFASDGLLILREITGED